MATSSDHFLALLRFSLGIDREFNFRPTADEWAQLYEQSLRQSLVGVTYEGVSRLPEDCFEPAASGGADAQTHLPQLLALQWANDAEVIAGLNDLQNRKAAQLTARFEEQGHRTVILKGQANALLYPNPLSRQPGDIDIYVDGGRERVEATLNSLGMGERANGIASHHFHLPPDEDGVEVEVHHRPCSGNAGLATVRRLQEYLVQQFDSGTAMCSSGFRTPSTAFALAMQLAHINRHIVGGGVGLRQVTDYYLLLQSSTGEERRQLARRLRAFGLLHAAKALMWVLGEVFHLPREQMMVRPDAWRGKWLMQEIVSGGNFGYFTAKPQGRPWQQILKGRLSLFRLAWFSPSDSLPILNEELRQWQYWLSTIPERLSQRSLFLTLNKTTK